MILDSIDTAKLPRPTYAVIDLEAFGHNIDEARKFSKSDIIAVLKADAYGHGMTTLAKYAYEKKNVRHFAVATMLEGVTLRNALEDKSVVIIVLGFVTESFIEEALLAKLTLPIFSDRYAKLVSDHAIKVGCECSVALELDTGMSRLGFNFDKRIDDILSLCPNIKIDYVMSHLATSDSDNTYAHIQTERFDKFLEINKAHKFYTSFLNSSGIACFENRWNFTRPGIMLYGYEGSNILNLKHVMSIYSEVAHVKYLKQGESVGYGRTFIADKDMLIGVVPIGYADGYNRSLSNKAYMLLKDNDRLIKCPVVGNVCMDMVMIDISSVGEDVYGKHLEIIGDNIPASLVASWAGTISYEILTGISDRVPRIYKWKDNHFEIF